MRRREKKGSRVLDLPKALRRDLPAYRQDLVARGYAGPGPGWQYTEETYPAGRFHLFPSIRERAYRGFAFHSFSEAGVISSSAAGIIIYNLVTHSQKYLEAYPYVNSLDVHPDQERLLVTAYKDWGILNLESKSLTPLILSKDANYIKQSFFLTSSPEKAVVCGAEDLSMVYDLASQKQYFKLDVHTSYNSAGCNRLGLIGLANSEIGVMLYDVRLKKATAKLGELGFSTRTFAFCGDYRVVLGLYNDVLKFWDLRKLAYMEEVLMPSFNSHMTYCPARNWLCVTGSEVYQAIFDLRERSLRVMWGCSADGAACFSPLGDKLFVPYKGPPGGIAEILLSSQRYIN